MLVAAILTGQADYTLTAAVISNLAFQGIIVSFVSLLLWFWLLRQYSASQLGVFTFMTPLFGIIFGVWLLDERIEESFVVGAILVILGIIIVSSHSRIQRRLKLISSKRIENT